MVDTAKNKHQRGNRPAPLRKIDVARVYTNLPTQVTGMGNEEGQLTGGMGGGNLEEQSPFSEPKNTALIDNVETIELNHEDIDLQLNK
jgi:hypothetical protein